MPIARRCLVSLVILACAGLPIRAAWAHAVLVASTPAIDGTVPSGQADLHLRYNSRIDHARSTVILTGPAGNKTRLTQRDDSAPDVIDVHADLSKPGTYVLRWQVLAVDGHITRGDVPFGVTPPAR